MKKSTFSIATLLYRRLAGLDVVREITGGLYKDARPVNSDKEDIVIQASGALLEPIPDYKRLEYLCSKVFDALDEVFSEGCLTWVDAQTFSSQGEMFCAEMEVSVSLRAGV